MSTSPPPPSPPPNSAVPIVTSALPPSLAENGMNGKSSPIASPTRKGFQLQAATSRRGLSGQPGVTVGRNGERRKWTASFIFITLPCCLFLVVFVFLVRARVIPSPALLLPDSFSSYYPSIPPYLIQYLPAFINPYAKTDSDSALLHPIIPLLRDARSHYANLIHRQSPTLKQAIATYKARYNRSPPNGFAKWYSFAVERNHTFIDEYDGLMSDLAIFSELPPSVLRQRTKELMNVPSISVVSIKKGASQVHSKSGRWAPALAVQEMIASFANELPDMDLAINERMEGRVLPMQTRKVSKGIIQEGEVIRSGTAGYNGTEMGAPVSLDGFKAEWRGEGSTWQAYKRSCHPDSAARRLVESIRAVEASSLRPAKRTVNSSPLQASTSDPSAVVPAGIGRPLSRRRSMGAAIPSTRELTFSPQLDAALDICARPSLHSLHSAFYSDSRSIGHLYPIFSPSKAPGFADILIPSHHYWNPPSEFSYEWELKKGGSQIPTDLSWDVKDDKIFWRGKVSKGADTPVGYSKSFQKQRLVKLATDSAESLAAVSAFNAQVELTKKGGPPQPKVVKAEAEEEEDDELTKLPPVIPATPNDTEIAMQISHLARNYAGPSKVLVTFNSTDSSILSLLAPEPLINDAILDIAMACDPSLGECQYIQSLGYKVEAPGPLSDAWKHKYVLDVDEVGFSPRFLALMESRSVVVKSSIQREFWQDWIVPWYHFIPLSSSFSELYNIQSFFSGFPETLPDPFKETTLQMSSLNRPTPPINPSHGPLFDGDKTLRDVGLQGSFWKKRYMRKEDMEVYMYRLMIEWAHLLSDERETS